LRLVGKRAFQPAPHKKLRGAVALLRLPSLLLGLPIFGNMPDIMLTFFSKMAE
jgi:hypothetical protein